MNLLGAAAACGVLAAVVGTWWHVQAAAPYASAQAGHICALAPPGGLQVMSSSPAAQAASCRALQTAQSQGRCGFVPKETIEICAAASAPIRLAGQRVAVALDALPKEHRFRFPVSGGYEIEIYNPDGCRTGEKDNILQGDQASASTVWGIFGADQKGLAVTPQCSAVRVGARTWLTAGHCVSEGDPIKIALAKDAPTQALKCRRMDPTVHEGCMSNDLKCLLDLAVCTLGGAPQNPSPPVAHVVAERAQLEAHKTNAVTIAGIGRRGSGEPAGDLCVGKTWLSRLPTEDLEHCGKSPMECHGRVEKNGLNRAYVASMDSGGAVFAPNGGRPPALLGVITFLATSPDGGYFIPLSDRKVFDFLCTSAAPPDTLTCPPRPMASGPAPRR